jgi:hypothetical protein
MQRWLAAAVLVGAAGCSSGTQGLPLEGAPACAPDGDGPAWGGLVVGRVADSARTLPLAHVTAATEGYPAVSDESDDAGCYALRLQPDAAYVLTASKDGYHPAKATRAVSPGETVTQDFRLEP